MHFRGSKGGKRTEFTNSKQKYLLCNLLLILPWFLPVSKLLELYMGLDNMENSEQAALLSSLSITMYLQLTETLSGSLWQLVETSFRRFPCRSPLTLQ